MIEQQKYAILSNELIRRLSNVSQELSEDEQMKEKIWIFDTMTQQFLNSGYSRKETAEDVVRGRKMMEPSIDMAETH